MTTVTSTTQTSASQTSQSVANSFNIDAQGFMKMLIAQAQNQDPTNPMDSNAYLQQIASISSVQQAVQTNSILGQIKSDMASLGGGETALQAATLIGRTVTSADGSIAGVVKSVTETSGVVTAVLASGQSVTIGDGVKVSA